MIILGSEGLEPSRPYRSTDFKSVVSTIPPRSPKTFLKTVPRFELGNEGFAIQSLTTWLYRPLLTVHNINLYK
jgi:hypothetical protein